MHPTQKSKEPADRATDSPLPLQRSSFDRQSSRTSSVTDHGRRIWMPSSAKPHRCPRCQSQATYRSARRGAFELLLMGLLPLRPFRCRDCDFRFYSFSFRRHSNPSKASRSSRMTNSAFGSSSPRSGSRPSTGPHPDPR